jgi:hypothetical protein
MAGDIAHTNYNLQNVSAMATNMAIKTGQDSPLLTKPSVLSPTRASFIFEVREMEHHVLELTLGRCSATAPRPEHTSEVEFFHTLYYWIAPY